MPRKPRKSLGEDQRLNADKAHEHVFLPSETVEALRYWHRQRCFAMEQRKRIDLALGSFLRMMLGWSLALPDAERKQIAEQASTLMDEPDGEWAQVIAASAAARGPFEAIEKNAVKQMEKLSKSLPVWPIYCENVRGFGAASLAVIVGEAGDLSNYSTIAKLWKRMGLAVFDGTRQGGLAKGAGAEAWIEHGYSPIRRSRMWNIGDTIIKGNRDGYYRTLYLTQKAKYVAEREGIKPIHAHRMAQRYMEKRLLKHLWQAWREAAHELSEKTSVALPPDEIMPAGVREASTAVSEKTYDTLPPGQIEKAA